jgi:hypothetical protein
LLKPRLCHGIAEKAAEESALPFSAATWAAMERGLAGDEPAARAAFDAARAALLDLDGTYAFYGSVLAAVRKPLSWRLTTPVRALRRVTQRG